MVHYGYISEVDPAKGLARVDWADRGIPTPWLPVIYAGTHADKYQFTPAIGQQVVFHLNEDGVTGYIAGAIHSEPDTPDNTLADADVSGVVFADGTKVYYHQGTGTLVVNSVGSVEVTAATEFIATVGTAEVKATTAGLTLKLGAISLKTILSDVLNALMVETHPTPAGPSSVPTNVSSYVTALAKVNTIFEA